MCPVGETIFDSVRLLSQPGCSSIQILVPHPSPYLAAGLLLPTMPHPPFALLPYDDTYRHAAGLLSRPLGTLCRSYTSIPWGEGFFCFQPWQSSILIIRCDDNPSGWDAV